jgi:site-specific DNA recombinase
MKRAAIYARFSSDMQSDRSIDDQVAVCRDRASRDGCKVVAIFSDRAKSGASIHGRKGVSDLLVAARERAFDVLIVEELDRLSRGQSDLASIYDRLTFIGIDIVTVHAGRADQVTVGVRGIVSALFLTDLAHKVRRGAAGNIRAGKHAGGRAYGYDTTPGKPGEWTVNEKEAAVIRRVFADYITGKRTPAIARALNVEGIKPPRGRYWQPGTLTGSNNRHNGILGNEIYCGRLVWNRVRMIKDPETGKRVSRPNPESEWQRAEVPQLAIISKETFDQVQAIKSGRRTLSPALRRKPKMLLSGLLRCGSCGGGMSIKGTDRGGTRIVCTAHQNVRACANNRSYYSAAIEEIVLSGLRKHLVDPRAIRLFLKTYHDERRRLVTSAAEAGPQLQRRLADVTRKAARLTEAMLESDAPVGGFTSRLAEIDREKIEIETALAKLNTPVKVVALHPAAQAHYLKVVDELAMAIRHRADASAISSPIRDLIESVTVHRTEAGEPIRLRVNGRLAALLGAPAFPDGSLSGVKMVAGARYGTNPNMDIPVFSMECQGLPGKPRRC